jgi:uncharacterized damage-inducible protein DinB
MNKTFVVQYQLIRDARKVLLDYCESFSVEHLNGIPEGYGNRSIKDILIHIPSVYIHWLSNFALKKGMPLTEADSIQSFSGIHKMFELADREVEEFLITFQKNWDDPISNTTGGLRLPQSPLTIFTHVITHEFHHKGQILMLSRSFGYTPPDTDVIRF